MSAIVATSTKNMTAFACPTPRELALHLLSLAANPSEYAKYHTWRASPQPFDEEFLAYVAEHVPGPREVDPLRARFSREDAFIIQRRAARRAK